MSNELHLSGLLFLPEQSKSVPATLIIANLNSPSARLEGEATNGTVTITGISDRIGSVDRRLELSDGSTFVTGDNDAVDRLRFGRQSWFSRVAGVEMFGPRLLAFVVIVVVLMASIVRYGLPVAAKAAVWATPNKVIELIDSSTLSTVDRLLLSPTKTDPQRQEELRTLFRNLAASDAGTKTATLHFRNSKTIGPNAFALPGGSVVVTDQLLDFMSNEEVEAVFAHELAHVKHQHGLQQMYRALGLAGFITIVFGDLGTAAEELIGGGGVLVAMSASREMELQSDADAVALLKQAGKDPRHLQSALQKLQEKVCKGMMAACNNTGWFSSHPGGEERDAALEALISEQGS